MKVTRLILAGFRSFGPEPETIFLNNNLTALIGLNSSGKTTALEALRKLFGVSTERNIVRGDFHLRKEDLSNSVDEKFLSIEAVLEFEDAAEDGDTIPHFFQHMIIEEENGKPYVRIRLDACWKESMLSPDGDIDIEQCFIKVPHGTEVTTENKYPFPKHLKNLIQVNYVPAIRRPSEQIKYASGTILYRILNKIKWDDGFEVGFEKQLEEMSTLLKSQADITAIQTSITGFWQQFHKDHRYSDAQLNFGNNDFESILKKIEVLFSPTGLQKSYHVDQLGEGYRSLFYLTLVCSLLEVEETLSREKEAETSASKPLLTILAIEEPENHIAPQLLGRVINILKKIAGRDDVQVVISSHTPAIIKRVDPQAICHFRVKPTYESKVSTISLPEAQDEAYKYIKQAVQNFPEIYFAKLVVIGEGDSEDVLFNRMMTVMNVDFDDNIITFAPLGHRFVNHIWRLLEEIGVDYITLLDLDIERGGGGWHRIKYVIDQLSEIGIDAMRCGQQHG